MRRQMILRRSVFALLAVGAAVVASPLHPIFEGTLKLAGRGPVSVTLIPNDSDRLTVYFHNDSEINVGVDVYDSAGDHVFGRTLTDKHGTMPYLKLVRGRTYKVQMRCNDGNPFNREKCRAHATWDCMKFRSSAEGTENTDERVCGVR